MAAGICARGFDFVGDSVGEERKMSCGPTCQIIVEGQFTQYNNTLTCSWALYNVYKEFKKTDFKHQWNYIGLNSNGLFSIRKNYNVTNSNNLL